MLDDALVCCLDMLALKVTNNCSEATLVIDGIWWYSGIGNDSVGECDAVIVLSVCGRLVDDTHTTIGCNIGVVQDLEAIVLELIVQIVKEGLVLPA
jgi:hypothetical protein